MNRGTAFCALGALGCVAGAMGYVSGESAPTGAGAEGPIVQSFCFEGVHASVVFAPGTPMERVNKVTQILMEQAGLVAGSSRFEVTSRWPGTAGTPATIRYSYPADGTSVPSGIGEAIAGNNLHATFIARFGSAATGKAKVRAVFDRWEEFSGNVYLEVSDDGAGLFASPGPLHLGAAMRGDVRIVCKPIDGNSGILAYNFFPGVAGGEMVLDSAESWHSPTNSFRFFRNTVSHEHGHGFGLLHVCPTNGTKLLEPFLNTGFDGPQHDDIRGVQWHYGDNYEPNATAATGDFLGSFSADGSATILNPLGLRSTADDDFFQFDVSGPGTVSAGVTPVGLTYSSGPQSGPSCPPGTSTNSLQQLGLRLMVLDTDGVTPLATADAGGLGAAESLSGVVRPAGGTYYVKLDDSVGSGISQLYNMTLSVTIDPPPPACPGDVNGDLIVDTADVGLIIDAFGDTGVGLDEDLNGDGVVDTADIGLVVETFGDDCNA